MAPSPDSKPSSRLPLWVSVAVLLLLLFFAIRYLTRERIPVRVGRVAYGSITRTSSTNGKVEPIDDFQAHAPAPGVVEQIYVDLDQQVRAGQILLRMDDADARARLAQAQANLQIARNTQQDLAHGGTQDERNANGSDLSRSLLRLQQDQNNLDALQKLSAAGAAAPAELAAARQRVEADQNSIQAIQQHTSNRYSSNDLAGAQSRIADAQAAVAAAQAAVNNVVIKSPIAGSVYSLPVAQYDYVASGDALVYVADLSKIRITAYFDEPEVGNLATGQPVTIVWEAKPHSVWHGHVTTVPSTILTYGTRNVGECLIDIDDPTADLLPNTNVTVTVTIAHRDHVLTVPRESVHTDAAQQTFVFRVVSGRLVQTPVQIGMFNQVSEEITSGLSDGDTVALTAAIAGRDLTDGMDVSTAP